MERSLGHKRHRYQYANVRKVRELKWQLLGSARAWQTSVRPKYLRGLNAGSPGALQR